MAACDRVRFSSEVSTLVLIDDDEFDLHASTSRVTFAPWGSSSEVGSNGLRSLVERVARLLTRFSAANWKDSGAPPTH